MLYILSILGILMEVSLPFAANYLAITLSFFVFLIAQKRESNIFLMGIIIIILSLQTNDFFKVISIFIGAYYLINFLFLNLSYNRRNIALLTLIQSGIYCMLSLKNFKLMYLIFNIIGFIILNYIYICISKKKEKGIKG